MLLSLGGENPDICVTFIKTSHCEMVFSHADDSNARHTGRLPGIHGLQI